jgi:UDP-glucose 4-epimerase
LHSLRAASENPDLIVHCAGSGAVGFSIAHPAEDAKKSIDTTLAVLEFIRLYAPDATLVIPSSAAVYGVTAPTPIQTTHPLVPTSPYGVHKKMAEDLCRSYASNFGVRSALVRLFSVYGIGNRKQLLWDACRKLASGDVEFGGTGAEIRDWLHVEDATQLLLRAAQFASSSCPVVNGGTGHGMPIWRVVDSIADALKVTSRPIYTGVVRRGDPPHQIADVAGAVEWGWQPVKDTLDEIRGYADWFRSLDR